MTAINQLPPTNLLLQMFPKEALAALAPALEPVVLRTGMHLSQPGEPATHVYFPDSGIASVIGSIGDDRQDIGLFGHDGAGSLSCLLGADAAPYLIRIQVPGHGHRVSCDALSAIFETDTGVRDIIHRFTHVFLIQVAQNCLANGQFNTVQRLARWFLMIHDRVEGDTINLTHDFIATMLGVGRTGVTLALQSLEAANLVSTARRRIVITNRAGLETMTKGVYGFAEAAYRQRFRPANLPIQDRSAAQ